MLAISLFSGSFAFAASNSSPGQGLEISPPVLELSANPGQTITTQIRVRNVTTGPLIIQTEADDFGASSNESGSPDILLHESGETRYSLKYWVSMPSGMELAPSQMQTVNVVINVPANAEPGGHYAVARFTGLPAGVNGTGVSLSASVGTLMLLRVNGPITEQVNVAQFSSGQQVNVATWKSMDFFQHGPVDFLVRLQDTGSIHEAPKGTITVKDMFGKSFGVLDVNSDGGNVLPGSIRRFVVHMPNKMLFGHYTAALAMTYAGNKAINDTASFWVIPWMLILLVIVGVAVIVYLLKVGLKRYNEYIIAQARRRR
jgi:hypothetical protein